MESSSSPPRLNKKRLEVAFKFLFIHDPLGSLDVVLSVERQLLKVIIILLRRVEKFKEENASTVRFRTKKQFHAKIDFVMLD